MSQHHFYTLYQGKQIHVIMGWDRPLQGYFLVIEAENDEDEPFWSNINHSQPTHPKTLQPFLKILDEFGIAVPAPMIRSLESDGEQNAGNIEYTW